MFMFLFCQRQLFFFFILGTNAFIGHTEPGVAGRGLLTRSMVDPKRSQPHWKISTVHGGFPLAAQMEPHP